MCSRNLSKLINFVEFTNIDDNGVILLDVSLHVLRRDFQDFRRFNVACHVHSRQITPLSNSANRQERLHIQSSTSPTFFLFNFQHRCKKRFFTFFIPLTFLTFFILSTFFIFKKKTFTENNKFYQEVREGLLKPQKQINRPRLYYESGWIQPGEQYVSQCL